jgi:hypothetical protein
MKNKRIGIFIWSFGTETLLKENLCFGIVTKIKGRIICFQQKCNKIGKQL